MQKNINDDVVSYQYQLNCGNIKQVYKFLLKYVMTIKTSLEDEYAEYYTCGNISPGYLDFTYFPFFNPYLRENKLRFGIVLNHEKIQFELWLMGQNIKVQQEYWNRLKSTQWNENRFTRPKYSVLEIILVSTPDFSKLDILTSDIIHAANSFATEIIHYLKITDMDNNK